MEMKVIIQGEGGCCEDTWTQQAINAVRIWHSGEIVVSTWDCPNVFELTGDVTRVLPMDPGPGPIQNINRQVVGLRAAADLVADDDLVFKIRNDMLCPKDPKPYFELEPCCDMFSHKVGISRHGTRCPVAFPWFIGDWIWFGLGQDIKKMASVDACNMEVISQAGEASWAKQLHDLYSDIDDPAEFLHANYKILNAGSDLGVVSLKFGDKDEFHGFLGTLA